MGLIRCDRRFRGRWARGTLTALLATVVAGFGCASSYEWRSYSGRVEDERGDPIEGVSVRLCYTDWDWDWNMPGGFPLTMDRPFCSRRVVTGPDGIYRVRFAGPSRTIVLAQHPDWIQERNYTVSADRIRLVRRTVRNRRRSVREKQEEERFRRRRRNETDTGYYCRVIKELSTEVRVRYRGRTVGIRNVLLSGPERTIVGVTGRYELVRTLAAKLVLRTDDPREQEVAFGIFAALPPRIRCRNGGFFIAATDGVSAFVSDRHDRSYLEVSGLRAAFPVRFRRLGER